MGEGWRRRYGPLERDTDPKGQKRPGLARPASPPRQSSTRPKCHSVLRPAGPAAASRPDLPRGGWAGRRSGRRGEPGLRGPVPGRPERRRPGPGDPGRGSDGRWGRLGPDRRRRRRHPDLRQPTRPAASPRVSAQAPGRVGPHLCPRPRARPARPGRRPHSCVARSPPSIRTSRSGGVLGTEGLAPLSEALAYVRRIFETTGTLAILGAVRPGRGRDRPVQHSRLRGRPAAVGDRRPDGARGRAAPGRPGRGPARALASAARPRLRSRPGLGGGGRSSGSSSWEPRPARPSCSVWSPSGTYWPRWRPRWARPAGPRPWIPPAFCAPADGGNVSDDHLGEFEHLVLLAILRLGDDAYGAPIRRTIEERAERPGGLIGPAGRPSGRGRRHSARKASTGSGR